MIKELPKGWSLKTLPEIVVDDKRSIKRGPFGGSLKKEIFVPTGYKVYEQKNAIKNNFEIGKYFITKEKFEEMEAFVVKPGDFIISCSGTIGKIALVPEFAKEGIINQALLKITLNKKKVKPLFFRYLWESDYIQNRLTKISRGVAIKNVPSVKILKQIQLPIPKIKVQQLIVDEIEKQLTRLDYSIKTFKEVKKKLGIYRKSLLVDAFRGKLVNASMKWSSIGNFVDMFSGVAFKKSEYSKSGIRLFQISNVTFGKTIWKKIAYLPENYVEKYPELVLNETDIVMALNRPLLNHVLKIAILGKKDVPSILYQRVGRFKFLNKKDLNPKFFFYYMMSPFLLDDLEKTLQGVNIPFINKSKLLKFKFPYCKLEIQEQIVQEIESRFSVIDKLEETVDNSLKKAEQLRKSILKSAFEGKLVKNE